MLKVHRPALSLPLAQPAAPCPDTAAALKPSSVFFSNSCCGPSTTDTAYFLNFVFFTSNLEQCLDCHNLKLLDKCQMSDILS